MFIFFRYAEINRKPISFSFVFFYSNKFFKYEKKKKKSPNQTDKNIKLKRYGKLALLLLKIEVNRQKKQLI